MYHLIAFTLLRAHMLIYIAQFMVEPVSVAKAEGLEAVFECQYPPVEDGFILSYIWAIDNVVLAVDIPTTRFRPPASSDEPATLTILAIPQHDNSVIQCVAEIRNGINIVDTEVSISANLTVKSELLNIE